MDASPDVHVLRARRLLRQLSRPPRHRAFPLAEHPIIRSYEPGEDWWFCYVDDVAFSVDGAPSFEHP